MNSDKEKLRRLKTKVTRLEKEKEKNNMWMGVVMAGAVIIIWIYTLSIL